MDTCFSHIITTVKAKIFVISPMVNIFSPYSWHLLVQVQAYMAFEWVYTQFLISEKKNVRTKDFSYQDRILSLI